MVLVDGTVGPFDGVAEETVVDEPVCFVVGVTVVTEPVDVDDLLGGAVDAVGFVDTVVALILVDGTVVPFDGVIDEPVCFVVGVTVVTEAADVDDLLGGAVDGVGFEDTVVELVLVDGAVVPFDGVVEETVVDEPVCFVVGVTVVTEPVDVDDLLGGAVDAVGFVDTVVALVLVDGTVVAFDVFGDAVVGLGVGAADLKEV